MKNILITGSGGKIGKALCNHFKSHVNDYNIKEFDIQDNPENNLKNKKSLNAATKGMDIVIHLAGKIDGSKEDLYDTNAGGMENLIKACKKNKVKNILFFSTIDVLFDNNYGNSKRLAEKLLQESGISYIILRPSIVYGPGFNKYIRTLVKMIDSGLVFIPGNGKNLYQPLFIDDLVKLIDHILDKNLFDNSTYFISGRDAISMNEMVDLTCKALNKNAIKIHVPIKIPSLIFPKLKRYSLDKTASNFLAEENLGFDPIGFEDGIKGVNEWID